MQNLHLLFVFSTFSSAAKTSSPVQPEWLPLSLLHLFAYMSSILSCMLLHDPGILQSKTTPALVVRKKNNNSEWYNKAMLSLDVLFVLQTRSKKSKLLCILKMEHL